MFYPQDPLQKKKLMIIRKLIFNLQYYYKSLAINIFIVFKYVSKYILNIPCVYSKATSN